MSVRNHRIAAVSILAAGVVVLLAWGRSMAIDSSEVKAVRDQFQGEWVASLVQAGEHRKVEGKAAGGCRASFDGKSVVFHNLVGGVDARGTYYIESSKPGQVDFKLDEGWIIGIYEVGGDTLKLCLNPFAPPEKLGVPTLPRPGHRDSGEHRLVYVFRRAKTGP